MRGCRLLARLFALLLLSIPAVAAGQEEEPEPEPEVVPANGLSIRLEGQLQVQGSSTSVDDAVTWDGELRRARITLIGEAIPGVSATIQSDFGRERVRIRDAYGEVDVSPAVTLRAGQFKIPFNGIEMVSSKRLLVIEREAEIRGANLPTTSSLLADANLSARNRGVMALFHLADERLLIQAGGWQGSGEAPDRNDAKEVAARVEYAVLPVTDDRRKPLVLGVAGVTNGYFGEPADSVEVDGETLLLDDAEYATAFELWAEYGAYLVAGVHVAGNVITGDNPARPVLDEGDVELQSFLGVQGWGEYLFMLDGPISGVGAAVRVDRFDPDTDGDDDANLLLTPGLNLYAGKNVKLQLNYDVVVTEGDEVDDESAFRIQGQVLL